MNDKFDAARAALLKSLEEEGGLDEYESREEGGPLEDGGYLGEDGGADDEEGGYLDSDSGGADDEEGYYEEEGGDDEEGGFDGSEDPDTFIEFGGKKKKRKKRRFPLFQKPRKRRIKRRAPSAAECARLGYGTLELARHNQSMKAGLPYVTVSKGLRIIETPIPLENRLNAPLLRYGLQTTALRTSHSPVNSTLAPAAGPYTLNVQSGPGQLNEVIGLALDIGPQPLNTQAGAIMSVAISGRYVDGDLANLGTFSFGLPSTVNQMRIVFFFYVVQNGAPRPKMMYAANGYTTPYQGGLDPATQPIVITGNAPAGLFLSATLLGPAQPTYENLLNAMLGSCC